MKSLKFGLLALVALTASFNATAGMSWNAMTYDNMSCTKLQDTIIEHPNKLIAQKSFFLKACDNKLRKANKVKPELVDIVKRYKGRNAFGKHDTPMAL